MCAAALSRLHRDGHTLIGPGRSVAGAVSLRSMGAGQLRSLDERRCMPAAAGKHGGRGQLRRRAAGRCARRCVQIDGTVALYDACVLAGVRLVLHVSALDAALDGRGRNGTVRQQDRIVHADGSSCARCGADLANGRNRGGSGYCVHSDGGHRAADLGRSGRMDDGLFAVGISWIVASLALSVGVGFCRGCRWFESQIPPT